MAVRKQKNLFKKHSVYSVLVLSYLFILLLTLSSNIIFYSKMNRQITDKTQQTKIMLLTQLRESFEKSTRLIENMANSLASDRKISLYSKGLSDYSLSDTMAQISTYSNIESELLLESFLYFKRNDQVLTPTMSMDAEKYFKMMYQYMESDYSEIKKELLETSHFQTYLPIKKVRQYGDGFIHVMTYVQSFPISVNSPPLGQVICLINADRLAQIVEQVSVTTDSDVYILDAQNHVIIKNSGAAEPDEETIFGLGNDDRSAASVFTRQVSAINGLRNWQFILSTPKTLYMAENRSFLLWMLAVSFGYLLVGLLIIRYFVERNYRPIREIDSLIKSNMANRKFSGNEYQAIMETLRLQFQDAAALNEQLESLNPTVRKEQISRLLKGMVRDYEEYTRSLDTSEIRFEGDLFSVVAVEIEESSRFFEKGSIEKSAFLARIVVQNIGCELFDIHFLCEYTEMDRKSCFFLINTHKDGQTEDVMENIRLAVEKMVSISEINSLILYAGVSSVHKMLRSVPLCYDESRKALEYSKMRSDRRIVFFSFLENLDLDYYFPSEIEYQIVSSLRLGDYVRAGELIDEIFYVNSKEKSITISAARNLLTDLGTALQKVLNNVLMSGGEDPQIKLDIYSYLQNPSLDKAKQDFHSIVAAIQTQQETNHKGKSEKLVGDMCRYIQDRVNDPELDLSRLSQEFHMTPQYISNIFKKQTGKTVKEYLSLLRLEKAKELLRTTDLSVRSIAQKIGYINEIGLIRLFKKYESMPPGEYRLLH